MKRAAVIVNPAKHGHGERFMAAIRGAMSDHGWDAPMCLETTADDPGTGQTSQAVAAGVDLVIACGGDGTVAACAAGVAGSDIPLGIVPTGTGNLLAQNLGLPLDLRRALDVTLAGQVKCLDVGMINGKPFVVMAGTGLDAEMIGDASEPLKKRLGWAAYAISVLRHLADKPMLMRLTVDGGPPVSTLACAVIVGNVGSLHSGIPLLPDAVPDDGKLDAAIVSARGLGNWIALAASVLTRQRASAHLHRLTFSELVVEVRREQPWEADGETMGRTRRLVVTVRPGRLLLMVPPVPASATSYQDPDPGQARVPAPG